MSQLSDWGKRKMKKMKKAVAVLLTLIISFGCLSIAVSAGQAQTDRFEITNPYKNIDWSTVKAYKTQLHCHTTASDGYLKIKDAVKLYYDLDYDAVAITDHGVNNLGWNKVPETSPLVRAIKKERTGGGYAPIEALSDAEYQAYLTGTAKVSEGYSRTNAGGLVDVEMGNELNLATPVSDCHLTHYWCDYGQGLAGVYGDYETPSKGSAKAGGVVMFSHVGEFVYPEKDTAERVGKKIDEYYVNKFARIILDYPVNGKEYKGSVAGMGINSATDAHTRCDRILYDQILQKTIPNGVVPWGFTFSDSHNETSMNDAYTMMLAPDWSGKNNAERNAMLRKSMENGEFFSVSHYSNAYELDGEREWDGLPTDKDWDWIDIDPAKGDLPTKLDENGNKRYDTLKLNDTPMVTNLVVDDATDTITVEAKNADRIVWVSDGNVIKRETKAADGDTVTFSICLNNPQELKEGADVNLFLRFYVTGTQGICYSQPMVLKKLDSNGRAIEFEKVNVPKTHDLPAFLRGLVTVLDWLHFKWSPVVWLFKYFAMGYNPIEQLFNSFKF